MPKPHESVFVAYVLPGVQPTVSKHWRKVVLEKWVLNECFSCVYLCVMRKVLVIDDQWTVHIQWTSIRCSLARWHWSWEIRCAWMCVPLLCVRLIHILNAVTWTICVVYYNTLRVVFRMWTELSCVDVQFSSSFCVDMSTPVSVVWTYQRCHRAQCVVFLSHFRPCS